MQNVAILIQPELDWPGIVAVDAVPGSKVARHWPDYPEVTGLGAAEGMPLLAVNEQGVFAAVVSSGTPVNGKRDSHELVLDLLDNPDAADAAQALHDLAPHAYEPFTLLFGDNRDCYVARNWQAGGMQIDALPPGCTSLGVTSLHLSDGLQPGSTEWLMAEGVLFSIPGLALFATHPVWRSSRT